MALPSDVGHAGKEVRAAYQKVLEGMVSAFESNLSTANELPNRELALALVSISVGAMVLARTVNDSNFADEICAAARTLAGNAIQ